MPLEALPVLPIGTLVDIGGVSGRVQEISIGPGVHVSYRLVWWDGKERRESWFHDEEIKLGERSLRIGFK